MACRLDDQNKLSLISISIPQNSVIIWDLAEQLKFPRKHFRHEVLTRELKFHKIYSMSQRKGEYLMMTDDGTIKKFRLPRRYQRLRELLHLQNNQEISPNLKKYLSTVGKDNIEEICKFIQESEIDLESMSPLDLFESPGFKEILIQKIGSSDIDSFDNKDLMVSDRMNEKVQGQDQIIIDEPFNEQIMISKAENIFWIDKQNLSIMGQLNLGFEVRDSGIFSYKSEEHFWVLLGKLLLNLILIMKRK
jgi:hypothetical protein